METQPQATAKHYEPNALLRTGMYALAVVGGIATASFKVWDRFYTKMKHTDLIAPLSEERYAKINAIYGEARAQGVPYEQYAARISKIERDYSRDFNRVLKQSIGVETEGVGGAIRGTLQRFETLGPYTKTNIAFSGAVAIGTTLGAYFLINQNMRLKHELQSVHARLGDGSENNR